MKKNLLLAALIATAMAGSAYAAEPTAAATPVQVSFEKPDKFVDASDRGFSSRASERVLKQIEELFGELGKRYLKPGESLAVTVTDIDLAGRYEPGASPARDDVRILTGATWPRLSFRYVLGKDGAETARGEENLSDMSYLDSISQRSGSEPLRYEKQMLDRWFARHFAAG